MGVAVDLILWRHAHAETHPAGDAGLQGDELDLKRRLTDKGERQARRMADWLERHLPANTLILVSPARRAQDTAKALGRPFKTVAALAPGAMPEALMASAHWPHAKTPVMLVGHQPSLGMVVGDVLGQGPTEHAVRKGAVWWLRYRDTEDCDGQTMIHTVQTPQTV
jgi:phosphohistidine phosphatase